MFSNALHLAWYIEHRLHYRKHTPVLLKIDGIHFCHLFPYAATFHDHGIVCSLERLYNIVSSVRLDTKIIVIIIRIADAEH